MFEIKINNRNYRDQYQLFSIEFLFLDQMAMTINEFIQSFRMHFDAVDSQFTSHWSRVIREILRFCDFPLYLFGKSLCGRSLSLLHENLLNQSAFIHSHHTFIHRNTYKHMHTHTHTRTQTHKTLITHTESLAEKWIVDEWI